MFRFFKLVTTSRFCWFLLFLSGIIFEACGLYFQYALKLDPCVYCVYERAYFLGFIALGLLGTFLAGFAIFRFLLTLGFVVNCLAAIRVTYIHLEAYNNTSPLGAKCPLFAKFPEFLPLDSLMPWMFKPNGLCTKLDWQFLNQSMPFWIMVIFVVAFVVALLMFLSNLFVRNKVKQQRYY